MSRKSETKATFLVTMDIPKGATAFDARNFIYDAVTSWGGGLAADHPFFKVSNVTVSVKQKVTTYGS